MSWTSLPPRPSGRDPPTTLAHVLRGQAEISVTEPAGECLSDAPIAEAGGTVTIGPIPCVLADAARLEQIFVTLVGNAVRYRRPGGPPGARISVRERECWWGVR